MRLRITHTTSYDYDEPVPYALQQLRLTPKSHAAQKVIAWTTEVSGGRRELTFEDNHRNTVDLVSFEPGTRHISVRCEGEVEVTDTSGVLGPHGGYMPLWMFDRSTPATKPGPLIRRLAASVEGDGPLAKAHALMTRVGETVAYRPGFSEVTWTAEEAVAAGHGVCQDQAHVFIACARHIGLPSRYVSGYLRMEDRTEQEATHAWAEVHIAGLGWVGFDVANDMCPDSRYVRVATGLDYAEAAPVTGTRMGAGGERLSVAVEVQEIQQQ